MTVDAEFRVPRAMIIADINGDSINDIIVAASNYNSADSTNYVRIVWWKGNGVGGFTTRYAVNTSNFSGLTSLTTADLDSDGDLEIIGTSGSMDGSNELALWDNNLKTWGP